MKKFIVTGLNFLDQPVMEVVYANSAAEAMRNSSKVAKNRRAMLPQTAASKVKR